MAYVRFSLRKITNDLYKLLDTTICDKFSIILYAFECKSVVSSGYFGFYSL